MNKHLSADALITGVDIATRILTEYPDLDEDLIDNAIDATWLTSANGEEWERQARLMLGINPFFVRGVGAIGVGPAVQGMPGEGMGLRPRRGFPARLRHRASGANLDAERAIDAVLVMPRIMAAMGSPSWCPARR